MSRKAFRIFSFSAAILAVVITVLWQIFFSQTTSFYLTAAVILIFSILPFLLS